MTVELRSIAEELAVSAENLPAFSGLKLLHVKRQLAEMLSLIGRNEIFDQYTKHDISHIDEMLSALSWIIPSETRAAMTAADWLMIVLCIYFHDLGMLVTQEEYNNRNTADYTRYKNEFLFTDGSGTDYKAKVLELGAEQAERFFYQEYVRAKHGERIKNWISSAYLYPSTSPIGSVVGEIDKLLSALDPQFRQDLGIVCESHHLDDLSNIDKYSISRPYGNSKSETVNLQFVAIVLRTSDLLHITRDRTPAVAFRIINPSDPISQAEWAKQMAVKAVRPKRMRNDEGQVDESIQSDTIEIHAFFKKPDGFFGLTSYITYAAEQLKQNNDWLEQSHKLEQSRHRLPWRRLDDQNVKTEGFLKQSFEFTLDSARILDLLTGHTLYNDTSVVLRELIQNSLDAIRLQGIVEKKSSSPPFKGRVIVNWDPNSRVLEVMDNGTGMTQQTIENHFLKVGSSRYQSVDFHREFPDFSSISRFGIGILSAFMISDEVEVLTCHPEEQDVRQLSLRSVHGKYLIQLLSKEGDARVHSIVPHGTIIRIRVRPSVQKFDVLEQIRRWVVVPACEVIVTTGGGTPVSIGYATPKEALAAEIRSMDYTLYEGSEVTPTPNAVKIIEKEVDGVRVAFATEWSEFFRVWSFLSLSNLEYRNRSRFGSRQLLMGSCVEGIRVEFDPPGFREGVILSIANATGKRAPRTNVARSGLELTPERDELLALVYSQYCEHVREELSLLTRERGMSLTWAVGEARILVNKLLGIGPHRVVSKELLLKSAEMLPVFIIEENMRRLAISSAELSKHDTFWTISGTFFRSVEELLREVESEASIAEVIQALRVNKLHIPTELILCTAVRDNILDNHALLDWEVSNIIVDKVHRRVDMQWAKKVATQRKWYYLNLEEVSSALRDYYVRGFSRENLRISIGSKDTALALRSGIVIASESIHCSGVSDEAAVLVDDLLYILPKTVVGDYLREQIEAVEHNGDPEQILLTVMLLDLVYSVMSPNYNARVVHEWEPNYNDDLPDLSSRTPSPEEIMRFFEVRGMQSLPAKFDIVSLATILSKSNTKVFNPSAWRRVTHY